VTIGASGATSKDIAATAPARAPTSRNNRENACDRPEQDVAVARSPSVTKPGARSDLFRGFRGIRGFRAARRISLLALAVLVVLGLGRPLERHARAAAMLLAMSGEYPAALSAVRDDVLVEDAPITPTSAALPGNAGSAAVTPIRARIYRPAHASRPRGVVLAHGVHHLGIDEPRLRSLAYAFARAGMVVLTPELSALADYRIDDPQNRETLRASVRWLARREDLVRAGGVGLVGVSFAGGLSLRVAEERSLDGDLAFVASIGGHHDLARVARFFVTDRVEAPEGEIAWTAHDYGLAVLVYDAPERFVAAADVPALRASVRGFLHESYTEAAQSALALSPDGSALYERIYQRDRHALRDRVIASLPALAASMEEASPRGRIADIRVPIFLLHGAADNVVPPSESRWIAAEANAAGVPCTLLVSEVIGHAEVGAASNGQKAQLVRFMAALLDA
jgi:dienelactone hydrolase